MVEGQLRGYSGTLAQTTAPSTSLDSAAGFLRPTEATFSSLTNAPICELSDHMGEHDAE
jgi:hypothetical protein